MCDRFKKFCQYLWLEPAKQGHWTKKFSRHPDFKIERGWSWYSKNHPKFAELCQTNCPDMALVNFWLNIAIDNSPSPLSGEPSDRQQLACKYLSNFLQETCYQVAYRLYKKYNNYLTSTTDLTDSYESALETIQYNNPEFKKFLVSYDSDKGSLEQYFYGILDKVLRVRLNVGRITKERLLCKASKKQLTEALQSLGETEPKISSIVFAHQFIQKIYSYTSQNPIRQIGERYPALCHKNYVEIARSYNYERKLESAPPAVFHDTTPVDASTIQEWCELAIAALNEFYNSNQQTLEYRDTERYSDSAQIAGGPIPSYKNVLDEEKDPDSDNSYIEILVLQQIEESEAKVEKLIASSNNSKQAYKSIPVLYYGLELRQRRIAELCGVDQGTIARQLQYDTRPLRQKLKQQRQSIDIPQCVRDWLFKGAMTNPVSAIAHKSLEKAWKSLPLDDRRVLRLYDLSCCSIEEVARELSWSQAEVIQKFEKVKAYLEKETLASLESSSNKLITKRLEKVYEEKFYIIFKNIFKQLSLDSRKAMIEYLLRKDSQFYDSNDLNGLQLEERMLEATENFRFKALEWIQNNLYVSLVQRSELNKLDVVIQNWLEQLGQ